MCASVLWSCLALVLPLAAAGGLPWPMRVAKAGEGAAAQGTIAFARDLDGKRDIFLVNADGSGLRNLTRSAADDYSPAWSPDGRSIAFASTRGDASELRRDIYLVDADGSGLRRLTRHRADDEQPAWSPDGAWIVFVTARDGDFELYLVEVASGRQTRLTRNRTLDGAPAWRPAPLAAEPASTPRPRR